MAESKKRSERVTNEKIVHECVLSMENEIQKEEPRFWIIQELASTVSALASLTGTPIVPERGMNRYERADWCFRELERRYGKLDLVGFDGLLMDLAKDSPDDDLHSVVNEIVKDMIQADRL